MTNQNKKTKLTKSQRNKINRIIRYVRSTFLGDERISNIKIEKLEGLDFVYVRIDTNRTDCDQYSPRNSVTKTQASVWVSTRGAARLQSLRRGLATGKLQKMYVRSFCDSVTASNHTR